MSSKIQLNLTARNNEDWKWTRQFVANGAPLALAGEPRMAVVDAQNRVILDLRVGAGLVFDGPNGTIAANVPAATMKALSPGVYSYDIQLRAGLGIDTPIVGTVTVEQGATRV